MLPAQVGVCRVHNEGRGKVPRGCPRPIRSLFVGERPSKRAVQIGASWKNGKLAGKTLSEALRAAGLNSDQHRFLNLYRHPEPTASDPCREAAVCRAVVRFARGGFWIVALGRIVSRRLTLRGIAHLPMIHPAARGANRKRERYHAHVAQTLAQAVTGVQPCAE